MKSADRDEQPRRSSSPLAPLHLPTPKITEQNYKMCLDGILERRYKDRDSLYLNPPPPQTRSCALGRTVFFLHAFFFALSAKSLLQKGESGQKDGGGVGTGRWGEGGLITLSSSNLILIFRRCKKKESPKEGGETR